MDDLKQELQRMVDEDQAARKEIGERLNIGPVDWAKVQEVDARNTARMKEIIAEYGWPKLSDMGEEAAHNAWLLAQHADRDLEFQKECLELMESLSKDEVIKKDLALLTDRILIKTVGIQRYGSQFQLMPTYIYIQPVEEPSKLDERRVSMGLDTMSELFKRYKKDMIEQRPEIKNFPVRYPDLKEIII